MAPFITKSTFRFHPSFSRFYAHLLSVRARIHRFPPAGLKKLNPRQFAVPVAFFRPDDMGPGPETNPTATSNTSNAGGGPLGTGAPPPPRHLLLATSLSHLNVWAYLALSVVILAVFAGLSYMIYTCYHTAGLRARVKPAVDVRATNEVKGGWQTLEDVSADGETTVVERDEEAGEKTSAYVGEDKKRGMTGSWGKKRGLKGLGIQLRTRSSPQYDFTPYPKESQVSIVSGSPHSTCSDRSLASASDHEHEQDLESSEGSDCPSLRTRPLAHTAEISAPYIRPMPLPLPLPLPPPVTPAPAQKQPVKQKRPRRLRAFTQILTRHNMPQTQNGREMYFELEPMITANSGRTGPSKFTLSEPLDDTPPSPSPPSSRSKFAFFAPTSYPNCISTTTSSSNSTSNSNSNATFSWGNHSSGSPTTFPATPTTPLTPITPMTPVTPIKPRPGAVAVGGLQFDSNNIRFIETPARNLDAGQTGVSTSPPEVQAGSLAAVTLTRAEMLWNDPKLSPVQGAFGVDLPISLDGEKTHQAAPIPNAPALITPDQVHRGHPKSRLGYLRRGVSLSSPPSSSPSSSYYSSSDSVSSSPSLATARFILDREELKRDNLRNRESRVKKEKEKGREKENDTVKYLSPIPRPVFLPLPKTSTMLRAEQPFV